MTFKASTSFDTHHDLHWTAFQYVADELRLDEAVAFERRLETDQAAREAVARVVELSQTVLALPAETFAATTTSRPSTSNAPILAASHSNASWSHPVGWMAVGVAACLMAMMTLQTIGPRLAPSTDALIAASKPATDGDAVALAWFRNQGAVGDVDGLTVDGFAANEDDASLAELSEEVIGEEVDGEFLADTSTNNARTPAWLLAALSAPAQPSVTGEN